MKRKTNLIGPSQCASTPRVRQATPSLAAAPVSELQVLQSQLGQEEQAPAAAFDCFGPHLSLPPCLSQLIPLTTFVAFWTVLSDLSTLMPKIEQIPLPDRTVNP